MHPEVRCASTVALACLALLSGPFVAGATVAAEAGRTAPLARAEFNRRAVERTEPLFWTRDADSDGVLDPAELAVTWGPGAARLDTYVRNGRFTPEFEAAYARIERPMSLDGLAAAEKARRTAVLAELEQGRPTLVLTTTDPRETEIAARLEKTARIIERLYARQGGVHGLDARIPADDTASRALFFRNQGPFCEAPKTENDPACSALAPRPKRVSGLYPESIQSDPEFCTVLEKRKDADALFDQFSVVRHKPGGRAKGDPATDDLVAVPYHVAYADDMKAVSDELRATAALGGRGLEGHERDEFEVVPARGPRRGVRGALLAQGQLPPDLRAHQPGVARVAASARAGQGRHGGRDGLARGPAV